MFRHLAGAAGPFVRVALASARRVTRVLRVRFAPPVSAFCLSAALFALPAYAFETELRVPESGTFPPTGPLEVYIPAEVSDEQLARLHLVIDGVDQRTRIEVRGDYARLVPEEPLTPGAHQLDLVELMPDGTVVSHGSWEFTVAGEAGLTGGAVKYAGGASITSNTAVRVLDNTGAHAAASSGSLDMEGRAEGGRWQANARMPFLYDTTDQTLANRSFDIADYLLNAQAGPVSAFAGHQSIENDNVLIQNDLSRRGLSGRIDLDELNSHVSVFQLQSSATSGFDNFLGVADRNDRMTGVAAGATPVDTDGFGMDVSLSYIDGRDPQLGPSTISLLPDRQAQTWGLSTTLKFLQDTLRLRGDFAQSNFEIPTDPAVDPEDGDTYRLQLIWSPQTPVTLFGDQAQFMLQTDYHRYSTFFTNPANTFDTSDQEQYNVAAQLSASEWTLGTQFVQFYDNVDDDPVLPRKRGRNGTLELTYSPAAGQDAQGNVSYGLLGTPTYGLSLNISDAKTVDPPRVGPPGEPEDTVNGGVTGRLDFTKSTWTWGVSYGTLLVDDRVRATLDLTHTADAHASFTFSDIGLTLTPSLQYIRNNQDGGRVDDSTWNGNFNADYQPTDIPVIAGLTFNFGRNALSDGSIETNTYFTQANVGWIALEPGTWPGLTLSLEGTHQYSDDQTGGSLSSEAYTAFLKASLSWSRTFGTR